MTRVGNTDQILALIRAQLQRMAKRERGDAAGKTESGRDTLTPRQRVEALATMKGFSDQDFARALIRGLLAEELGEGVASSPGFQSVLERTYAALDADAETRAAMLALRVEAQLGR
jgi:hypothetical protein